MNGVPTQQPQLDFNVFQVNRGNKSLSLDTKYTPPVARCPSIFKGSEVGRLCGGAERSGVKRGRNGGSRGKRNSRSLRLF
jgi:hypothetical protein